MKETNPIRKVGEPYTKEYVEIHYQSTNGKWYRKGSYDSAALAEASIAEDDKRDKQLRWMIDMGKRPPYRLVKVKAECVVLKVI